MIGLHENYQLEDTHFSEQTVNVIRDMTGGLLDVEGGVIDITFVNTMEGVIDAMKAGEIPKEQMVHYLNMLSLFSAAYAEALYAKFE